MFSLVTAIHLKCQPENSLSSPHNDSRIFADRIGKATLVDSALVLVFSILAALGFAGVLPFGVGIGFCVVAGIQLALTALCRVVVCALKDQCCFA